MTNDTPPKSTQTPKITQRRKAKKQMTMPLDSDTDYQMTFAGTQNMSFAKHLLDQVCQSYWQDKKSKKELKQMAHANYASLQAIHPKNEMEAMLAAQMIAIHNAAMECFRRAMHSQQPMENRDINLKHATKLTKAYGSLLETLNKHRGKGHQKMTVEHVHVHNGGQAIVGQVSQSPPSTERESSPQKP